jgi:N-methylhydantoinase A/oxoprolinase/acetone carboxylase beta subunit
VRRVAVDVGGTFTDFVFWSDTDKTMHVHKRPSTPADPAEGFIDGLRTLCNHAASPIDDVDQVLHGTTVGMNIVLERKGADVGVLTTEGFRDLLHIARHRRPLNFTLRPDVPWQTHPIAKRRNRLAVVERIAGPDGQVVKPLDEESVRERVRQLRENGVEAIAICFLFSFLNPAHERRAMEIVREEWPEVWVSTSSDVVPKMREYERFSTACLDACIGPKVSGYIKQLETRLGSEGYRSRMHLMTSSGGLATGERASEKPSALLLSGAVGGLIGGIWVGETADSKSVITLDVGGTSADIGVAPEGETRLKHLTESGIGGYSTSLPMVDVDTIGAGGGSIAHVADSGLFSVGPQSAGADPGPACYGRGGELPTVTDAAVVTGILGTERPLGGSVVLQHERAVAAVERGVAEPLGLEVHEAACGVLSILVHNMVQAIELNSIRKGYDPRDFALVAIGGAGPMFGGWIARELSIPRVIVPPHPGICSAMGLLATDVVHDVAAPLFGRLFDLGAGAIAEVYGALAEQADEQLALDDVEADRRRVLRYVECRYAGQSYELRVSVGSGAIDDAWLEDVGRRFEEEHQVHYGAFRPSLDVELVTVGVRALGLMVQPTPARSSASSPDPESARVGSREVWFVPSGEDPYSAEAPVYDRDRLHAGNVIPGPAIVEQFDTTTFLEPGSTGRIDAVGNLVIEW